MTNMDELKRTFFDECNELLQEIETGLTDMREGTGSDDTVHAVFRGVHSVKGGAGIFGFEVLVEFAHVFETVLDAVRQGSMETTSEVVDVLLVASDVLTDLVAMARAGEAIPPEFGNECRAALERLIGDEGVNGAPAKSDKTAPADFAGIDFVPIRADDFDAPAEEGRTSYAITFRPRPEMLKNANEPLYILRELRSLGELDLVAETDALPPLPELQPDYPYIGWTGTLRTSAKRQDIEAVFEFVVGDCVLEIVEVEGASSAVVAGDAVPLVPSFDDTIVAAAQPVARSPGGPGKGTGTGSRQGSRAGPRGSRSGFRRGYRRRFKTRSAMPTRTGPAGWSPSPRLRPRASISRRSTASSIWWASWSSPKPCWGKWFRGFRRT